VGRHRPRRAAQSGEVGELAGGGLRERKKPLFEKSGAKIFVKLVL